MELLVWAHHPWFLDYAHSDSCLSTRGYARLGFSLSIYGMNRLESLLLVLDPVHMGPTPFLRSFCHTGFALPLYGMSRLDLLMFVLDLVSISSAMSLQGFF